ncbi:hypothetical protein ScPMuIL_010461 [Solemya velum]
MASWCISLFMIIQIPLISGRCYFNRGVLEKNDAGGSRIVCLYEGVRMLNGSLWKTAKCEICGCSEHGMFCCGFVRQSGVHLGPESNNECWRFKTSRGRLTTPKTFSAETQSKV